MTVTLGPYFTIPQIIEYIEATITISDRVCEYSTFWLTDARYNAYRKLMFRASMDATNYPYKDNNKCIRRTPV